MSNMDGGPTDTTGTPVGLIGGGNEAGNVIAADPPPAPGLGKGLGSILKDNLFKDVKNSILTLVSFALLAWIVFKAFGFVFLNEKTFEDGAVVRSGWEVVRDGPLQTYMLGNNFGNTGIELSTIWIGIYLAALTMGLAVALAHDPSAPPMRRNTRLAVTIPPVIGALAILSMTTTITPWLLTAVIPVVFLGAVQGGRRLPESVQGRAGLILFVLVVVFFFAVVIVFVLIVMLVFVVIFLAVLIVMFFFLFLAMLVIVMIFIFVVFIFVVFVMIFIFVTMAVPTGNAVARLEILIGSANRQILTNIRTANREGCRVRL